jgi:hypothetical protein
MGCLVVCGSLHRAPCLARIRIFLGGVAAILDGRSVDCPVGLCGLGYGLGFLDFDFRPFDFGFLIFDS